MERDDPGQARRERHRQERAPAKCQSEDTVVIDFLVRNHDLQQQHLAATTDRQQISSGRRAALHTDAAVAVSPASGSLTGAQLGSSTDRFANRRNLTSPFGNQATHCLLQLRHTLCRQTRRLPASRDFVRSLPAVLTSCLFTGTTRHQNDCPDFATTTSRAHGPRSVRHNRCAEASSAEAQVTRRRRPRAHRRQSRTSSACPYVLEWRQGRQVALQLVTRRPSTDRTAP